MSGIEDVNNSKDEDDLSNEDLVDLNTKKASENIIQESSDLEISADMAQATTVGLLENSNESGDDITDILHRDSVQSASTSKDTDSGDGTVIGDTTMTKEVNEESNLGKLDINNDEITLDNLKKTQDSEKVSGVLNDEMLNDEDLELRWDEDDERNTTPDNNAVNSDAHKIDNDLEEVFDKTEKKKQDISIEPNSTEADLECNVEEETELILEEKLLLEPVITIDISENPLTDVPLELDENELLQEIQPEDTEMMDVDTSDKNGVICENAEIVQSLDGTSKIPEKSLQEITLDAAKVDDEFNSTKEVLEISTVSDLEAKTNEITTQFKNLNDPNLSNNDDSQELNLSMDVDGNTSLENSPVHFKTSHGLSKPDVMLEIPTQELIDIDDVTDSPNDSRNDDSMGKTDDVSDKLAEGDQVDVYNDSGNEGLVDETLKESVEDQTGAIAKAKEVVIDTKSKENIDNETEADNRNKINNPDGKDDYEMSLESKTSNCNVEPAAIKSPSIAEAQPSTSTFFPPMTPDTSDEVPEVTDCLGLLAESSRVIDEDEDQDDDDDGDVDEDDDFDQDESSNQMTGEHSEDSNAPHSETEPARGDLERDIEDREEREADDVETETNQCEEDFTIDEVDIDDDGINEQLRMELKKELGVNDIEDGMPLLPDLQNAEQTVKIKKEKNIISTCVEKEKDSTSISQENVKKEKEEALHSEELTQKSKEDTVQSKDVSVQCEEVALQSIDAVKKEKEDAIQVGVTIKKEKEDTTKPRKTFVTKEVMTKDNETLLSSASSVTSNDDVVEQHIEIETVRVSDDEDEEPLKESQEKLQQETDMTTLSEKTLEGTTAVEKITLVEKVTTSEKTVEKSTELEKTAELEKTSPSETTTVSEEPPQPEKTTEPDNATIDLTPDQINTEESHTADGSTRSPESSPGKLKDIVNTNILNTNILSIVELGESSSEDDIQEVTKETLPEHSVSELKKLLESSSKPPPLTSKGMTTVNIPTGIDIMSTSGAGGNRTQIVTKEGEVVISGVPKPPPHKPARLNTSEVTIKTASSSEQTLVIPEAKAQEQSQPTPAPTKPKLSLEIFSLDSDEEETTAKATEPKKPRKKTKKCINSACSSGLTVLQAADIATAAYYDASRKKRPVVCEPCADAVLARKQHLVSGIKNFTPLLQLDTSTTTQDLVEILDSESEDEDSQPQEQQPTDTIGEEAAKFLEENLADILNESWKKYNLDERLKETKEELNAEILKLEEESKEINQMLEDCQRVTDKLRLDLYASFEHRIQELPPLLIFETPEFTYMGPDTEDAIPAAVVAESRLSAKRKMATNNETPAKRPAIPLGYAPLDNSKLTLQENKSVGFKADDDKDISVVKLSAESAPADLPPPGELSRPPLRVGMAVYAMKNAFGPWFRGRVLEIMPKNGNMTIFTTCRIKFDHKVKNNGKILPARCIAYADPADVRMTIGTRLIALFKDSNKRESYYSGVVAEIPNPVNNYRYLVFFDDGYAQYVGHAYTRLVCECSPLVWEEVHPLSREFVREYLMAYPERPMVRLHEGQHLKTEWDGKWWSSRVCRVDASLAQVVFLGDGRREWIYRGSTRLAPLYLELRAAERHRPRPMPRSKQPRSNMMPYVEYTRSVEQINKAQETQPTPVALTTQQQNEEIRRQRAVAKKSTSTSVLPAAPHGPAPAPGVTPGNLDTVTSRVVYYTPKNAVRPYKLVPHKCSPKCKRSDVLSLKELRTYNPLAKPLLSGWERQIVRFKGQKEVMYRAPCGRRLRSMRELHRYLRATESELPVDLFDFYHATHCLAEFVLNKCLVGKKDLSHGKENVPVPCVNYYDDSLPEFCSYNTERTPTSGVPLNLDPEFLCGCDCTDDCEDKSKCACWKMTLEGARTIGLDGANVGYEYKRLPEPLPSGIYECNSRCKCKQTCLNRVAQHPLQLKLQVFKTLNRGWGIRALNDVPKGSFLCVYAGNLLTDATANLDGLNEGDEYLAELDYIEVVEQMKEGYEEDIPDADKKLDKKDSVKQEESDEELSSSSEEDENASKTDKEDYDFRPGYIALGVTDFNKRLRRRAKNKMDLKEEEHKEKENKGTNPEDDCITISDDEEVREPSRFAAKPGMGGNDFISKYSSVRTLFGEDEACYIVDAKVQGNIGRYLNHSCSPNVFVQNVFVDTHDPRFPWVAFFALSHVKAGSELTWNYNYDVGSVPGKILYCYCEAPNCRGRLL